MDMNAKDGLLEKIFRCVVPAVPFANGIPPRYIASEALLNGLQL